jgi:hypothetical protein
MSDSPIFELMCEQLESEAKLSRLEARGTVRLLLKEVGLDPQQVGKGAAMLAVDRFLEQALRVRRVAEPQQVKTRVLRALRESTLEGPEGEDPEAIFGRITLRR